MKTEKQRLLAELMTYWVDELIDRATDNGRYLEAERIESGGPEERDIRVLRQKILGYASELMEDSPTVVQVRSLDNSLFP